MYSKKEIKVPRENIILNLPGFTVKKVSGYNPVVYDVRYRKKPRCPHCGCGRLRKKSSCMRQVHHEPVGFRRSLLRFKSWKFRCYGCERYFNQRFPGIGLYQRATERLKEHVYFQHTQGVPQKELAQRSRLGCSTIERWYHAHYERLNSHLQNRHCPTVLGIDEHRFSKRIGFATTFCDLRKHKVFDIAPGRSGASLFQFLSELRGKERVKVVCIDLSSSYLSIIKRYFPNAKIVADRFHVIRLINHMTMQAYQQLDPNIKYQRGLLRVLRMKPEKLTYKDKVKRSEYFKLQPAIKILYEFKQGLHTLLCKKGLNPSAVKQHIPDFLEKVNLLKESAIEPLAKLGRTLYKWREEIARMWRFSKNNGITEGFHRKMKLIQRRAYGFKNFENYRLRVKVLCA